MAVVAKITYIGFINIIGGGKLSTIVAIIVAAIIYFILLIFTGSLTYEDFNLLPNGDKIANKLVRLKLIKKSRQIKYKGVEYMGGKIYILGLGPGGDIDSLTIGVVNRIKSGNKNYLKNRKSSYNRVF